jgi:UDP-N-acetylmuramate--alanine ligase
MLLPEHPRIHLVGAGGAGMSGLGRVLAQSGHTVSGSDLVAGRPLLDLEDVGVVVWQGHRPDAVTGVDLVVRSSAVPDDDPEVVAAIAAGRTVWARPRLLEAVTAAIPTIGATGTHGKTTTSALLVTALGGLGRSPSFVVGGHLVDHGTNAAYADPELLVLEADEAFGTFLDLHLRGLVVTNVEPEHLDHFGDVAALEDAFVQVMRDVDGPVVACADDPGAERAMARSAAVSYGLSSTARWRVTHLEEGPLDVRFTLTGPSVTVPVRVGRPGLHVARNAAGALALVGELGWDVERAALALAGFSGVARRFHLRARVAGVTFVDDYAHHPTEVLATLRTARLGSWNRIWAIFQPHLYSRTAALANEFGQAFDGVDELVVTDVYGSRETPVPGITGRLVADAARARTSAHVRYVPHLREVPTAIVGDLAPGDLVLTLGAGDITLLVDDLAQALSERA